MLHYLWNEALDLVLVIPGVVLIGAVGAWRWCMWLGKIVPALFYRPIANDFRCTSTVVATVFDEDPRLFRRALESWIANRPNRIIAVVDVSDQASLAVAREYANVQVIVNHQPGKRPGLAAGVAAADTDIVVLVDSDVLWAPDVLTLLQMPFADSRIGGASVRAHMTPTRPEGPTVWERLADIYLDLRYTSEVPATTCWGAAVSCLSGRTSAYRTRLLQSLREPFLNESFNGRECLSGDDKRYTCLVLERGFKTWHQLNARVYSTFKADYRGFINQRVRWQRNSFRSDLRALGQRWLWRHPYLAVILVDKHLALFTQLNGPFFLFLACLYGSPAIVLALIAWWHVSRAIKIAPHLYRRPGDIVLLPVFIAMTFWLSAVKFYALCTLNKQGWLTRPVAMIGGKAVRLAPTT